MTPTPKELPALMVLADAYAAASFESTSWPLAKVHRDKFEAALAASLQGIERDAARALDDAFKVEIERVSTVQYNSNEICRAFYERLRNRFDAAMKDAP